MAAEPEAAIVRLKKCFLRGGGGEQFVLFSLLWGALLQRRRDLSGQSIWIGLKAYPLDLRTWFPEPYEWRLGSQGRFATLTHAVNSGKNHTTSL